MNDKQQKKLESMPSMYQGLFERIYNGQYVSPKMKVKAFCLECVGYQRKEVEACSCYTCPLHTIRPYQTLPPGA